MWLQALLTGCCVAEAAKKHCPHQHMEVAVRVAAAGGLPWLQIPNAVSLQSGNIQGCQPLGLRHHQRAGHGYAGPANRAACSRSGPAQSSCPRPQP